MNTFNEITLRGNREPMSFERLKFLCYFIAGLIAEVLGFATAILFLIRVT